MPTVALPTMGTVASIRTDAPLAAGVVAEVAALFERIEDRYSLYRPTSELARVASGALRLPDASAALRDTYARALVWRSATGGAFTPHRPDGVIDLSGLVKADAIAAAGRLLDAAVDRWLLTIGGDVLGRGSWRVGVVDPADRGRLRATVELGPGRRAVATSGTAERGEHVWRRDGGAAYGQVTVVAADIVPADVLATAILAGGPTTRAAVEREHDIEVLALAPVALVARSA